MSDADRWARQLAGGEPIAPPAALVVAHPDDESLFAGAALRRLRDLRVIVLTDGAPEDMTDAHRNGFVTRAAYAACRAAELERALTVLAPHARLIRYDVPDQQAVLRLGEIVPRLVRDLAGCALVLTHPYEGGHPDHDTVAFAVWRAASELGEDAPAIIEFACYAQLGGTREFANFVPNAHAREHVRTLEDDDLGHIERALGAHASQTSVFGAWRPTYERWRAAPNYDFRAPPPGDACLYDEFGWSLTSAMWRAHVAAADLALDAR